MNKLFLSQTLIFSFYLAASSFSLAADSDDIDSYHDYDAVTESIILSPIIFPIIDKHRGRRIIQQAPPEKCSKKCEKGYEKIDENQPSYPLQTATRMQHLPSGFKHEDFDQHIKDRTQRRIEMLEHGSVHNQFIVEDQNFLQGGLVLGGSVIDPHTIFGDSFLNKVQGTLSYFSRRHVNNYQDAVHSRWRQTPKRAQDFSSWNIGDSLRKYGVTSVSLYTGPRAMTIDLRAGSMMQGMWSRTITKISDTQIRVSFSKEEEAGPKVRARLTHRQNFEIKKIHNRESAYVYLFDLTNPTEKDALELLLNQDILPGSDIAKDLADNEEALLLTNNKIERTRKAKTPLQGGIPLMVRVRYARSVDENHVASFDYRNHNETNIAAKIITKNKMYRHINASRLEDNKSRKYFTHSHAHFDHTYRAAVTQFKNANNPLLSMTNQNLEIEIAFSHDNAKVRKVDKYFAAIASEVGINDFIINTGYKKNARIGYVRLAYNLMIDSKTINKIAKISHNNDDLFAKESQILIDKYFNKNNDPHEYCRSPMHERCERNLREQTLDALKKIRHILAKINRSNCEKNSQGNQKPLAKIAKLLTTNQFVLQSFIVALPSKKESYGKLSIVGTQLLPRSFNVDANRAS